MNKKSKGLATKILAALGVLAVAFGIVFSILWFVPSIHDAIWVPETTTTEDDTTTDTDTSTDTEGTDTDNTDSTNSEV